MDRGDGRTKYLLEGEGVGSVFVIDGNSGNIHVTKPLDREEKAEYRLLATATDRQTGRALEPSSTFIIRVQDINDNPPVFAHGPYLAVVPEMANIGVCGSVEKASVVLVNRPLWFWLTGVCGSVEQASVVLLNRRLWFWLTGVCGSVEQASVVLLNRRLWFWLTGVCGSVEQASVASVVLLNRPLWFWLTGVCGSVEQASVVLVNRRLWFWLTGVCGSVEQASVVLLNRRLWFWTSIITVTARDADDPAYGNSARLVYSLTQGQDFFSVDPQTGVLRTAVPDMDRETRDEYVVELQARDMGGHQGGLSGTTSITVRLSDVNDNPPHFRRSKHDDDEDDDDEDDQSSWSFSVSELAAPGVEVGRLTASDSDLGENALLEFSILDSEQGDIFNISAREQEAVVTLNKLLDYESCNSYTFSVEVSNPLLDPRFLRRGPFKDQATVRVSVLNADEPPRFSQSRYHLDVSENCPPVCSVGRVSATDPDTGQSSNIRFSIDPQSDPEALFRISSDSGFISTVMELDREQEQWHNITVIATQRDNPNLVSRVVVAIETLDQNDNAPVLDRLYSTSVCDSSPPGQVIQVLRALDRDQGGKDVPIHFSFPPESSLALNLSLRDHGGETASLVLQSSLQPLPSPAPLLVAVVMRDGASGLTHTGTVTLTVCPCLRGGMHLEERGRGGESVCLPLNSPSPSLIFSLVTFLSMLACVTTLLVVCALSMSLRHQKREPLSAFEEDDVRENIISYDDEGGGEADTAAFDITALQSLQRVHSIWYTQPNPARSRTYSWSRPPRPSLPPAQRPGSAPIYGRLCLGLHTLPVLRDHPGGGALEGGIPQLISGLSGGFPGVQNQRPFQSLISPGGGLAGYGSERLLQKIPDILEGGGAADFQEEHTKINPAEFPPPSTVTLCSLMDSLSSASSQRGGRRGSNQTQISTDSSIRSEPPPSAPQLQNDSYSIVGSLSASRGGASLGGGRQWERRY
ncbi:hypothetical protein NQZ68_040320 [Dissostichus eleginoides]|nr:hypothetical protein NQZ68_040320 [Dissostichus eleginoides]